MNSNGRQSYSLLIFIHTCSIEHYINLNAHNTEARVKVCMIPLSLVPRPGRRRKKGLVPIARTCANYPKKTWGTVNYCTFFRPPPAV